MLEVVWPFMNSFSLLQLEVLPHISQSWVISLLLECVPCR